MLPENQYSSLKSKGRDSRLCKSTSTIIPHCWFLVHVLPAKPKGLTLLGFHDLLSNWKLKSRSMETRFQHGGFLYKEAQLALPALSLKDTRLSAMGKPSWAIPESQEFDSRNENACWRQFVRTSFSICPKVPGKIIPRLNSQDHKSWAIKESEKIRNGIRWYSSSARTTRIWQAFQVFWNEPTLANSSKKHHVQSGSNELSPEDT